MANDTIDKDPSWLSDIKPIKLLVLSPEDVWAVMTNKERNTMSREEFMDVFYMAAKLLSHIDESHWNTIRYAIDDR